MEKVTSLPRKEGNINIPDVISILPVRTAATISEGIPKKCDVHTANVDKIPDCFRRQIITEKNTIYENHYEREEIQKTGSLPTGFLSD